MHIRMISTQRTSVPSVQTNSMMYMYSLLHRYPWGEEAFAKAREENKPIFLSVGYSTCHWCHVMERESFEREETGKILNENFVSIKVDREERPDVDRVYMTFVQVCGALTVLLDKLVPPLEDRPL